jgi:HD-GYP domain-containing protein (c-di-GMP phosphodiesterase class II)
MFLHEIKGNWLNHPFWKKSFILDSSDIEKLIDSEIESVIIDVDKGLKAVDLNNLEITVLPDGVAGNEHKTDQARPIRSKKITRSVAAEIEHAKHLLVSATRQMKSVFQKIRADKTVSAAALMPLVDSIIASVIRSPSALASLVRLKDHDTYTHMHSVAVCALMVGLAVELELDEQTTRTAGAAGLMHDIGKALMPLAVLNKPDRLTAEEFEIAKLHSRDGWNLVQTERLQTGILDVILHHHEKLDGSGYPDHLEGHEISMLARMGAVCDVYDAVTSDRPYKKAWPPASALLKMKTWENHFDNEIFAAFVHYMGFYPVGSLVRLKSGYLAVVLDQNRNALSRPIVKKFFSLKSQQPIFPEILNLAKARAADQVAQPEDPAEWDLPQVNALWLNHHT